MRLLPGASAIGVLQTLSEVQVTVAPLKMPSSSTSDNGLALALFGALFHLAFGATPAASAVPIGVPAAPTKLILMARLVDKEAVKFATWLVAIVVNVRPGGVNIYPLSEGVT